MNIVVGIVNENTHGIKSLITWKLITVTKYIANLVQLSNNLSNKLSH